MTIDYSLSRLSNTGSNCINHHSLPTELTMDLTKNAGEAEAIEAIIDIIKLLDTGVEVGKCIDRKIKKGRGIYMRRGIK